MNNGESFENAAPVKNGPGAPSFGRQATKSPATYRELPHSVEAEETVLATCLLDGADTLVRAQASGLTPASFYDPKHGAIFGTMLGLHADQKPVDIATVAEELKTAKQLDAVGGYPFLSQVSARVATTAQAAYFIEKVRHLSMLREIIRRSTALVEDCYEFTGSFDDRISPAINRLNSVLTGQRTDRTWAQAVKEAEEITRERMLPPEERKREQGFELQWGIADFDRFFQPIELGELVVIGGYTSSGKSSLCRQVLWAFAKHGHGAMLETIETRDVEEAINYAAHLSGIRSRSRLNELHHRDREQLMRAFAEMNVPHFSVCHDDHNLDAIFGRARMFKRKHKLRGLGVDYLQLLEDVQCAKSSSERAIALARCTSACKKFATREELAVLLLSGFNRDYVRDGNREPRLADLEGGSAIEKDASRVLLLHIPTEFMVGGVRYTQSLTADASEQPRMFVKVIQAKSRNTGTSSVGLWFRRETKTFEMIPR